MAEIKYVKIDGPESVEDYLFQVINEGLSAGKKVFWMAAGGSAMEIAAKVSDRLKTIDGLSNLAVTLTDERYGSAGHQDSNWRQLTDIGFSLPGARLLPVLKGKDIGTTASEYARMLNEEITSADYAIALAGLGADSHIFGIKPHSPAVNSSADVAAYKWQDYQRITPTSHLLAKLDEIVIFAVGPEKRRAIEDIDKVSNPQDQPSQLLKQFKKVIIFNDTKGEPL